MQKTVNTRYLMALFSALLLSTAIWAQSSPPAVQFDRASVTIGAIQLEVELAQTFEQRARGLMFRQSLCDQCGMLFKYARPLRASMWMKNTFIPLDVAFINQQGVITDIKAMQPQDLTPVGASQAVVYALEMNLGWFAAHDVAVGDKVTISTP